MNTYYKDCNLRVVGDGDVVAFRQQSNSGVAVVTLTKEQLDFVIEQRQQEKNTAKAA